MPDGSTAALLEGKVTVLGPEGRPSGAFGQNGSAVIESLVGPNFVANGIAVDPAGRILVAGALLGAKFTGGPTPEFEKPAETAAVLRLTSDGELDPSFGKEGVATFTFGFPPPTLIGGYIANAPEVFFDGVTIAPDGRLVLTGLGTTSWSGERDLFGSPVTRNGIPFVARLTEGGAIDPTFGGSGIIVGEPFYGTTYPVSDAFGRIAFRSGGGKIGTVEESGAYTPSLGGRREQAYAIPALGPDDRIYVLQLSPIHEWGGISPSQKVKVLALNWDGTRDAEYGEDGVASVANRPRNVFWNIAVDGAGRVVLGGVTSFAHRRSASGSLSVVRLLPSGDVDRAFASNGWAAVRFPHTTSWYAGPELAVGLEDAVTVGAVARYRGGTLRAVLAWLHP